MHLRSPYWEWLMVDVGNIIAVAVLLCVLTGNYSWWLALPVAPLVALRVLVWARRRQEWKDAE